MTQTFRRIAIPIVVLVASVYFFNGCSDTCTYPLQRAVSMRFINAMVDFPNVTLFINGKLFRKDYPYNPDPNFGYYTTYDDGTPLPLGDSLLFVLTSDPAGKDTLVKQWLPLDLHVQTVIAMGFGKPKLSTAPKTAKFLRLVDDDVPAKDRPLFLRMRFVHAIPDLPGLDVYFKKEIQASDAPFCTLKYGESTIRFPFDADSAKTITGLIVTEAGNKNNIIFAVPYPFSQTGFYITILVRGSSKPIGQEPIANPFILADDNIYGNYILDFSTSAVRLVNGMRDQKLSLLVTNPPPDDRHPRDQVPGQAPVLNVNADIISPYFPVGVAALGNTVWFFATGTNEKDTIHSFLETITKNQRVSMISVEKASLGQPAREPDDLTLHDTMTCPGDPNFSRVRVTNLSPDHTTINFTLGGRTVSMKQKDVEFFTVPTGQLPITFTDGTANRTYTLSVKIASRPLSLFILPDKTTQKFPVALTDQ